MIDWLRSRCLLGHDWERWEQFEVTMTRAFPALDKQYQHLSIWQRRDCKRCGKRQEQKIS